MRHSICFVVVHPIFESNCNNKLMNELLFLDHSNQQNSLSSRSRKQTSENITEFI